MILSTLVTSQLHFEMCAGLYGHPVFHAGAPQRHFITAVLHAGKFPYAKCHLGAKLFASFLISTFISLATNLPMKSYLRSG